MVAVAQLVEHQIVVLRVVGSNPIGHPNKNNMVVVVRKWSSGLTVNQENESSLRVRISSSTHILRANQCDVLQDILVREV